MCSEIPSGQNIRPEGLLRQEGREPDPVGADDQRSRGSLLQSVCGLPPLQIWSLSTH